MVTKQPGALWTFLPEEAAQSAASRGPTGHQRQGRHARSPGRKAPGLAQDAVPWQVVLILPFPGTWAALNVDVGE